jgi:hypothetical protein
MRFDHPASVSLARPLKPLFQAILAGLLMAAAAAPLQAASTVRFALSTFSVVENAGHAEVAVLRTNNLDTGARIEERVEVVPLADLVAQSPDPGRRRKRVG